MRVQTIFFALFLCVVPAAAASEVAAVVGGRSIALEEVDVPVAAKLAALEQQMYAIRKASLDNLIVRAVLEQEAARQKITVDELKEQLSAGAAVITAEEVERRYEEFAGAFDSVPLEEARERLRLDLQTQARMRRYREAVEQLRRAADVRVHLAGPHEVARVPEGDSPARGPAGAPVSVIVFSDFECSYCKAALPLLDRVAAANPKDVRLVYKYFPLPRHADALPAARAAHCADRQNAFWAYHDALLNANDLSSGALREAASGIGLDLAEYDRCIADDASRKAVVADLDLGRSLGVSATPTVLVNGAVAEGPLTFESLQHAIARARESRLPSVGPTVHR